MALILKGKRINLRSLKISDAKSIYKYVKHKDVLRYVTLPQPYRFKHATDWIRKTQKDIRNKKTYELGIELKETGEIIGAMGLVNLDMKNKNAETGCWVGKPYWRKGIAEEAKNILLDFAFGKLKLVRVYAKIINVNKASTALVRRSGFTYEGTARKAIFRNNKWYDVLNYGLLKEEFKKKI